MLFTIETTGNRYIENAHKRRLMKLGFTFNKIDDAYSSVLGDYEICDSIEKEINTLEDLLKLQKMMFGIDIILSGNTIEIYDNYRE